LYLGLHAVKLIGWGEQDGVPFWTIANSWGATWGEQGFFQILRGSDECGIENAIAAGTPGKIQTSNSKLLYPISVTQTNEQIVVLDEKPVAVKPNADYPQPSFPAQFYVNFTIPSLLGPTINGTWSYDYVNQYQRMDYYLYSHDFATIYDYKKGESYYFFGLFNEFVCYTQPIPTETLPAGVPDNSTFLGFTMSNDVNISTWLQNYPLSAVVLEYYVMVDSPHLLLDLDYGFGMFQSENLIFQEYQLKAPEPSVFQVPTGTECLPWPGVPPTPPPSYRATKFFRGLI